jgi:hypothetical protein
VLALTGALAACAPPSDESEPDSAGDALIGGEEASPDAFPSTVYLESGCTAVKVGASLLLTAAHCVLDPTTVDPRWKAGDTLKLARPPADALGDYTVAATHVSPEWKKACERTFCAASAVTVRLDAPDVAVIELTSDVAGVPIAPVDANALATGDRVTVLGFGCTDGVLRSDETAGHALKAKETTIIDGAAAVHEGSTLTTAELPAASGTYAMTAGPGLDPSAAGLCPGDSGGPMYRRTDKELLVVGVNANYTFRPDKLDDRGLPVTNWHTRLDDSSRQKVGPWLRTLGVVVR